MKKRWTPYNKLGRGGKKTKAPTLRSLSYQKDRKRGLSHKKAFEKNKPKRIIKRKFKSGFNWRKEVGI